MDKMRLVLITPLKDSLLAEFREKTSDNLKEIIKATPWLRWKQMWDVNGKGRMQWYLVADTSFDKDTRLKEFAKILCEDEKFYPSPRICPHDNYYEDYDKYFSCYK